MRGHRGRIAWAGPDEFWTVSDGRPGRPISSTPASKSGPAGRQHALSLRGWPDRRPTLCASRLRAGLLPGDARGGVPPSPPSSDCWFGGDPLAEPQIGAFHLHWNGSSLEAEPYPTKATPSRICSRSKAPYESVRARPATPGQPGTDRAARPAPASTPRVCTDSNRKELPLYGPDEPPIALEGPLRLSDRRGSAWAGRGSERPDAEAGRNTAR